MNSEYKILIVEDELVLQLMLERMLMRMGFRHFEKATKGREAVDLCKNRDFDLILMDIMLQDDMDGIEAYQKIREETEVDVIYITGNTGGDYHDRAEKYGYHDFLGKPIIYAQLEKSIARLLNGGKNGSHNRIHS